MLNLIIARSLPVFSILKNKSSIFQSHFFLLLCQMAVTFHLTSAPKQSGRSTSSASQTDWPWSATRHSLTTRSRAKLAMLDNRGRHRQAASLRCKLLTRGQQEALQEGQQPMVQRARLNPNGPSSWLLKHDVNLNVDLNISFVSKFVRLWDEIKSKHFVFRQITYYFCKKFSMWIDRIRIIVE